MIKLKDLLPEDQPFPASLTKLTPWVDKIKQECPIAVKEFLDLDGVIRFYRGVKTKEMAIYHDPRGKFRRSKDSNNFSLLYSGINPDWENIPKRYSSVVFSTTRESAKEYGGHMGIYYVFVVGDPPVAFGKTADNYSNYQAGFKKASGISIGIESLDAYMGEVFSHVMGGNESTINLDTMKTPLELKKALDSLEIELKDYVNFNDYGTERTIISGMKKLGVYGFLNTVFDPTLNEIQVRDLSGLDAEMDNVEIWTEAPVYLINEDYEKELIHLLTK